MDDNTRPHMAQLVSDGLEGSRPNLICVPAHVGIAGNEAAALLVKSAANDSSRLEYPMRPLTATHCRLRLAWSREHALWTPQQWACVMFSNESRFSLQSDSRRTFIWRAPGTRYHQENIIERHRYGDAAVLVSSGLILGSRTDLHVQIGTMTSQIYRDVILEQHVRLFRGAMGAQFVFMDDNARPHRANIVSECLQSEDITRMDWPAFSLDLKPVEHVWDKLNRRVAARQPPPTCLAELRRAMLLSGVISPKIRSII
ncbi:Transposable element Tcb1 transposase, partial [Stegodyphus mimosarum]